MSARPGLAARAVPSVADSKRYRNLGYWLLALPAAMLAGFWVPYLSQVPHFAAGITGTVHLHAVFLFAWMTLLVVQPFLIRSGALRWHRRLGRLSFALFGLVVLSAIAVTVKNYHDEVALGSSRDVAFISEYLAVGGIVLIILLYGLAVRRIFARDVAAHLRYMLCSGIVLLPAGVSRLLGYGFDVPQAVSQTVSFTVIDIVLLGLIAYDHERRLASRPYAVALLACVLFQGGWLALGRPV